MAWEQRKGRRYYYRSRKVRGRVVREYVGTGEVAEVAARLDAEAANARALRRIERLRTKAELEELDAILEHMDREVNATLSAAMALAGFHWHRGEWRRKRTVATSDAPTPSSAPSPQPPPTELIARARTGDTGAMSLIRPLFDDPQNVDAFGGNVAERSAQMVITRMVGKDLVSEEAIQRKLALLRTELAGPNPDPLERLLVDRVVTQWLHLYRLEGEYAVVGDSDPTRATYYQRSITLAQNRYIQAIRSLTDHRRTALPPVQVNIAREQVNVVNAAPG